MGYVEEVLKQVNRVIGIEVLRLDEESPPDYMNDPDYTEVIAQMMLGRGFTINSVRRDTGYTIRLRHPEIRRSFTAFGPDYGPAICRAASHASRVYLKHLDSLIPV